MLQDGARKFEELFASATIDGETPSERLDQLLDVLAKHYGTPQYLAFMQVMLNLDHDPATSPAVRTTLRTLAEVSTGHVRRRLRETLGPAADAPGLPLTIFLALKGFVLSQRLLVTVAYDTVPPKFDGVADQRNLLSQILAPYLEQAAAG